MVQLDPHPLLDTRWFVTTFPKPLGELGRVESIMSLLATTATAGTNPPAAASLRRSI